MIAHGAPQPAGDDGGFSEDGADVDADGIGGCFLEQYGQRVAVGFDKAK